MISEWDEPKKRDCIKTIYRIVVNGEIVKEGKYAIKQTKDLRGRTIYKRKWNESKREWMGEWMLAQKDL
jgi:hypothetical protein